MRCEMAGKLHIYLKFIFTHPMLLDPFAKPPIRKYVHRGIEELFSRKGFELYNSNRKI